MVLTTIDIIVLGIILLFAIIGLCKGFVKVVISLSSGLLSLLIAYFLAPKFTTFLQGTVINDKIFGFLLNWVNGKGEIFSQPIPEGGIPEVIAGELNLPGFLIDFINKLIESDPSYQGQILGEVVANSATYYVLMIIAFIVLSLLARIIIAIISKLLTKLIEKGGAIKFVNRLLGLVVGICKGALIVFFIFWIAGFLSSWIGSLNNLIVEYINPDSPEFGIARWIYNHNFIDYIINNLLNPDALKLG